MALDLLPSVNKANSVILRVEKQRAVQGEMSSSTEGSVMQVKIAQQGTEMQNNKRNQMKDERNCDYCKGIGHTRDTCFKLHG